MDINNAKGTDIETYWHGKMNLMVGLCESVGVPGKKQRVIGRPFSDSQSKILRYLLIPEEVFCWNGARIVCDA